MNKPKKSRSSRTRHLSRLGPVLVVCKRTRLEELTERNDEAQLALIASGDETVKDVVPAHEEHHATLGLVLSELRRRRIKYDITDRNGLDTVKASLYRRAITVGGDGTVIAAGRRLTRPVLGVNSAPTTSTGHFCIAKGDNFGEILDQLDNGRKPLAVMLLEASLNGKPLGQLVLNEMLVEESTPGAPSRYIVSAGAIKEAHRSDGLFIGTAAGSTGWTYSYRAQVLPIDSRQIHLFARGLICPPGKTYRLEDHVVGANELVRVISQMDHGRILLDARVIDEPFNRGSELIVRPSRSQLQLYIDANANTPYMVSRRGQGFPSIH